MGDGLTAFLRVVFCEIEDDLLPVEEEVSACVEVIEKVNEHLLELFICDGLITDHLDGVEDEEVPELRGLRFDDVLISREEFFDVVDAFFLFHLNDFVAAELIEEIVPKVEGEHVFLLAFIADVGVMRLFSLLFGDDRVFLDDLILCAFFVFFRANRLLH